MPSAAAAERLAFTGLVVVLAVTGTHALPVRDRRNADLEWKAPCPNDTTGLIPLGCSVELTDHQETLLFVHQYSPLEECSWYVNNQFIGDTRYPLHREYALANGHTAVVSNFAQGQSDLRMSIQGKNSSLEGMEVKCSCQPRGGEPGPSTETQTVIVDKRFVKEAESQKTDCYYLINDDYCVFTTVGCTIPLRDSQSKLQVVFLQCLLPSAPRDGEGLQWEYDRQKLATLSLRQTLPARARGNVFEVMDDVLMITVGRGDAFTALNGLSVSCSSGNTVLTSTFSV